MPLLVRIYAAPQRGATMVTTNQDIRRFRELARQGLCVTHATRAMGWHISRGLYWAQHEHIDFQAVRHSFVPDPAALARLRSTMLAMRLVSELGAALAWLHAWAEAAVEAECADTEERAAVREGAD